MQTAEEARRKALAEGDEEGAAVAEMQILASLLECQFGSTQLDTEQRLISLLVSALHLCKRRRAQVCYSGGV